MDYTGLDAFIDALPTREGALITTLHKAQELFGYLPSEVQSHVSKRLGIPESTVYGVVTFYSFFHTSPKGKLSVSVCMGTACFVRGAEAVLKKFSQILDVPSGSVSGDLTVGLDAIRCVGACGLAPVVTVNGRVYGRVSADDVEHIVEENRHEQTEKS